MGVGPSNVTRWIKEGKLKGCINPAGKINQDKAVKQVKFLLNPHHQRNPTGNKGKPKQPKNLPTESDLDEASSTSGIKKGTSTSEAQRVKLVYEAMLKKIEFETKKGQLIEVAEVERLKIQEIVAAKSVLLGIRTKIGALIDEFLDLKKREIILSIVDGCVKEALEELSNAPV